MAFVRDIVVDCRHPATVARFWAAALDGHQVAPYDDEELARLAAMGITDPEDDPTVLVEPPAPDQPRFFFQHVPETKATKNRLHLDLQATDPDAERQRLIALGATLAPDQPSEHWWVLADPEGNEFCLFREPPSTG